MYNLNKILKPVLSKFKYITIHDILNIFINRVEQGSLDTNIRNIEIKRMYKDLREHDYSKYQAFKIIRKRYQYLTDGHLKNIIYNKSHKKT